MTSYSPTSLFVVKMNSSKRTHRCTAIVCLSCVISFMFCVKWREKRIKTLNTMSDDEAFRGIHHYKVCMKP